MDVKENLSNDNHIVFLLDSKCPFKYVSDRESIGRMKNKWNEKEKSCRDERGKVPKERKRVSDNKPYVLLFHKYTSNFGEKHSSPQHKHSHSSPPHNAAQLRSDSFKILSSFFPLRRASEREISFKNRSIRAENMNGFFGAHVRRSRYEDAELVVVWMPFLLGQRRNNIKKNFWRAFSFLEGKHRVVTSMWWSWKVDKGMLSIFEFRENWLKLWRWRIECNWILCSLSNACNMMLKVLKAIYRDLNQVTLKELVDWILNTNRKSLSNVQL